MDTCTAILTIKRVLLLEAKSITWRSTSPTLIDFSKIDLAQSLGEDVCNLFLCWTVCEHNISLLNMISQKMMSYINVLCSLMMNWILSHTHSTSVVTHERTCFDVDSKIF